MGRAERSTRASDRNRPIGRLRPPSSSTTTKRRRAAWSGEFHVYGQLPDALGFGTMTIAPRRRLWRAVRKTATHLIALRGRRGSGSMGTSAWRKLAAGAPVPPYVGWNSNYSFNFDVARYSWNGFPALPQEIAATGLRGLNDFSANGSGTLPRHVTTDTGRRFFFLFFLFVSLFVQGRRHRPRWLAYPVSAKRAMTIKVEAAVTPARTISGRRAKIALNFRRWMRRWDLQHRRHLARLSVRPRFQQ